MFSVTAAEDGEFSVGADSFVSTDFCCTLTSSPISIASVLFSADSMLLFVLDVRDEMDGRRCAMITMYDTKNNASH